MGFKHAWDKRDIANQLCTCAMECRSPYNDGWVASGAKRDLVELKWLIEDLLEDCPTFAGEEKWEQERLMQILKRK